MRSLHPEHDEPLELALEHASLSPERSDGTTSRLETGLVGARGGQAPRRGGPPTMDPFDAVLFDLDGTLLDSIELILASYHHTIALHGLPPQTDAVILEGLGTPLDAQLRRWTDAHAAIPAMIETYRAHNFSVHDAMVRAYPGVSEVVLELRERGTKLAVVTSKRRDGTLRGLASLGLLDAFDLLVCADDVRRPKPHPEPVLAALAELGVTRERTAFVGDSTHDMEAGRAAGVHTVAVLWGPFRREALLPTEPRAIVATAEELRRALGLG